MPDVLTPQQRHRCMSHIRSKATKPEMLVRRWLWSHGYRYRLNVKSVPGKPDIVMRKYRTAIFVNGKYPDGLCSSAWDSMRPFVESLAQGRGVMICDLSRRRPLLPKAEGRSGMKNPMSAMISCNDGFRPFSFYIEVIEEPESSQQTVKMYDASHKLKETWQYD